MGKIEKLEQQIADLKKKRLHLLEAEAEKKQEKKEPKKTKEKRPSSLDLRMQDVKYSYAENQALFYGKRKSLKELLAPDGVDPNNYGYLRLNDGGRDIYIMCFYIDKMPRNATFATTFAPLFNFKGVTSSVFVQPMGNAKAIRILDKRVMDLDTELVTANHDGDRNRARKIGQKMADAEGWAKDVESGANTLYEVSFLFVLSARTKEELQIACSDFRTKGLERGIELVSCYSVHPEAFLSAFPTNRIFKSHLGPISTTTVKTHQFDKYALATIFNHTRANFYHQNGVYLGRDMATGKPVTIDFYDPSLEAHNVIVTGATGTGKSALIKMMLARMSDFGVKYCSIDFESRGKQGEYALLTKRLGGENFQIRVGSNEIINIFEINTELDYDEATGKEELSLHLVDKISIFKGLIMTMVKFGKLEPSFKEATALDSIIGDIIAHLFEMRGIYEGDPGSLYEGSTTLPDGTLILGEQKKSLPTICDFYREALIRQRDNTNPAHKEAYAQLLDSMKAQVKELYYVPGIVKFLSKEEYQELLVDSKGRHIYEDPQTHETVAAVAIRGVRAFFDGESTIHVDLETPALNIDISGLPENDRIIALVVATNYINENVIKKNSANPKRVQKRCILIEEGHKLFPYEELRRFLSDLYRTARKRFVAPILATQALADCNGYKETEDIVKQTPVIFMLRQARQDEEFLAKATCLTPSQMDRLMTLGGKKGEDGTVAQKGQVCMIVNNRVAYVQVDYLRTSETEVVETDMRVIQKMVKNRKGDRTNGKMQE